MKHMELINSLTALERLGVFVLTKKDVEKLFPQEGEKSMEKSLQRMVKDGLLIRAARGIYVNALAVARKPSWILEDVAKALRPGNLSYVSLESILSEYGVISQIPLSRITLMTTGAKGVHETPFGTIEFTHTKRTIPDILERTIFIKDRPLRIAKKHAAVTDLLRVGRNTDMIDYEELEEVFA
jgi:predicted transcriptional regulator of viral defense system